MKKRSLYLLLSLATAGFVSCNEDFNKDIAAPQTWEQEAAKGITFTTSAVAAIDLAAVSGDSVAICSFSAPAVENENTTTYKALLSNTITLDVDAKGRVSKVDLQGAVVSIYNKRPEQRTLPTVVNAFVNINGQSFKVSSAAINLIVTPQAPVIETAYYITGELAGGWGSASVLKLTHSGKDVYEDPIFTLLVNNTAATANFKIIPQSGIGGNDDLFWGSALGTATDGDTSLTGTVVSANAGAIQVAGEGWFKITLDMMSYTYTIEKMNVSPYLWVPGNHQGWNPATAPKLYTPAMDLVYTGHAYMDGGFKFTGQADWSPVEYGYGSFASLSTNITDDGGNMAVTPGFYFLRVNLNTSSFEAAQTTWAIIGDATVGGWSTDTPLVYNKGANTWTVTTTLTAGSLKFRANNDWAINMGGTAEKLLFNKDNLTSPGTGNYTITLHLSNDDNSYCTFTKNE